jgi:hypothetical protein
MLLQLIRIKKYIAITDKVFMFFIPSKIELKKEFKTEFFRFTLCNSSR